MFDDEDKARIHTRVQARGRRPAGEQWPTNHADRDRAGDLPIPAGNASPADQAAEIARLRRELDRTRMERDILKNHRGFTVRLWP